MLLSCDCISSCGGGGGQAGLKVLPYEGIHRVLVCGDGLGSWEKEGLGSWEKEGFGKLREDRVWKLRRR